MPKFSYEGKVYRDGMYVKDVEKHETIACNLEKAIRNLKFQIYQDADIPKNSLSIDEDNVKEEG